MKSILDHLETRRTGYDAMRRPRVLLETKLTDLGAEQDFSLNHEYVLEGILSIRFICPEPAKDVALQDAQRQMCYLVYGEFIEAIDRALNASNAEELDLVQRELMEMRSLATGAIK